MPLDELYRQSRERDNVRLPTVSSPTGGVGRRDASSYLPLAQGPTGGSAPALSLALSDNLQPAEPDLPLAARKSAPATAQALQAFNEPSPPGLLGSAYNQGGVPQALGAALNAADQGMFEVGARFRDGVQQVGSSIGDVYNRFQQGFSPQPQPTQSQPQATQSTTQTAQPELTQARQPLSLSTPQVQQAIGGEQGITNLRPENIPQGATTGPIGRGIEGNPNISRNLVYDEQGNVVSTQYTTPQGTAEFQGAPAQTPGLFAGYRTDAQAREANPHLFEQTNAAGHGLGLAQAYQQQADQLAQARQARNLNRQAGRLNNRLSSSRDPKQRQQGLETALQTILGQLSGISQGQQQGVENQLARDELKLNASAELLKNKNKGKNTGTKEIDSLFGDVFIKSYSEAINQAQFTPEGQTPIDPVQAALAAANQAVDGLLGTRNQYFVEGEVMSFTDVANQARQAMQKGGRTAQQIVDGLKASGARGNLDQLLAVLQ